MVDDMAEDTLNSPMAALGRLGSQQKVGLIFAIAALVALLAGLWMWGTTPNYRVLFSNLSDRDGGAIIQSLQQMNVPYKITDGGGAVLVPAGKVGEVRLRLASKGLPRGGNVGFELMENQKFGTSQFVEHVNYQRALEGELARSVQTLSAVRNARVHLAIPKQSVFVQEQEKPTASVVLQLYSGRSLDDEQVNAVVHLIASSVPDMPAKNVTVVDQDGNLLSSPSDNPSTPLNPDQLKYVQQIENNYSRRIVDIVAPLVGANNVHAQVTANIDFTQTEQTAETYQPNQPPNQASLRSEQIVEDTNGSNTSATGVPGALSNQPPVPATAPLTTPSASAATGGSSRSRNSSMHKESTSNFELNRTISYTKQPVGTIRRLSVAVILNERTVTDKNGKTSSKPLSAAEKAQITSLVKDAIGFDEKRGDTLNILNSAFNKPKVTFTPIPLWKQPATIALAEEILKYVIITGIGLFLLFGIIKPSFNKLAQSMETPETGEEESGPIDAAHPHVPQAAPSALENNLMTAKQMAQQDPKMVATVVKEWVSGNE